MEGWQSWSNAPVLKTGDLRGSGSSNLSPSAKSNLNRTVGLGCFFCKEHVKEVVLVCCYLLSALISHAVRGALAGLGDAGIPDSIVLLNVIKIKPLKKIKKA